ncbi:coenzyme F420-reducing hydrogenase, gamma subunit [Anaerolinea thermolimosa]|uniref:NADH-quinone oxidoreductase subunit B family protein n=1 Tax=Anaerolinea thermolimosa TaxID=229919 RepID=UPI0007866EA4|nr:NADP oxidoreductase [Anaerolinea thermolimosa]GAP06820.1 coenzyme F420-reducing hydrogenase, gamma subunit [Anaerolinea thermolimosa]
MSKPKISTDWMCGCAGCHMSLLDIDERILKIAELADIRATPITDLKEPDESGVDVGILEGGINNTANEEVAHRMRKRCKILVALGDCAVFGGVPAMRNFFTLEETLKRAYIETESTDSEGKIPDNPELARMTRVRAVHEVVPVDIFVPGCPPDPDVIYYVLSELAQGRKPELKGELLHWH